MIAALIKALAYFGTVFLLGAGVYHFFTVPGNRQEPLLRWAGLGAGVLIAASLADVTWRLWQVLGRFDPDLTLTYIFQTAGGRFALLRLALVLLTLVTLRLPWHWPFVLVGLGVLYSFSATSHAAVMNGAPALIADLAHFTAASLWGGAVLYTALTWNALGTDRLRVLERVSSIGLGAVLLLLVTGIYTSTLHLETPNQLVSTPYGLALTLKLSLVAVVLGIAALNRWHFLPRLRADPQSHQGFGRILILEACLLLAIFAATGLLSTSPLPHD